jgi:hypothetical protein
LFPVLAQTLHARSILERYKQLVFSLDALLDLCQQRSLATLIRTRHLGDLLAALIQVTHFSQRSLATLICTRHLGDLLAALIQVRPKQ